MSVIKPEYISSQVSMHDLLPLSFLKKSPYTGSKRALRYRIEKAEEGEGEELRKNLKVSVWTTPYAWDLTPAEEITVKEFPFTEDGLQAVPGYLNSLLEVKA